MNSSTKPKGKRGLASMSPEKRREIASLGGKAAHAAGTAHKYTSEEGRVASALRCDRRRRAA